MCSIQSSRYKTVLKRCRFVHSRGAIKARERAHSAASKRRSSSLFCIMVLILIASPAPAQVSATFRISQRATISQRIGPALVSLDYSRPGARGRSPLFGKVVHWGEIWTPGANEATVLELSDSVTIEGHDVPAGRWSLWMIPSNVGAWELVLDPADSLFHTQRPELGGERQIRFPVRTEADAHTEFLTWSFPQVDRDRAMLVMEWGTTRVPLQIEVDFPMPVFTVTADVAAQYTGEWEITFLVGPDPAQLPPPAPMQLVHGENGTLISKLPPQIFMPPDPGAAADTASMSAQERERAAAQRILSDPSAHPFDVILVPRTRGMFLLGFVENGVLLDIENLLWEFEFEGNRAVRFTTRDDKDQLVAQGRRMQ